MQHSSQRQSGQAAVESALVMPLMVFMCLGIVQLTMLQHAKLMTEYAAYQAARAGIVWGGNNERMHDAAIVALLPTMGRTDSAGKVAETWLKHQLYDTALAQLSWGVGPDLKSINASNLIGFIRVDTVNPAYFTPIDNVWKLRDGLKWTELDFDGPDTYPEVPTLEANIAKFFNLPLPDNQEEVYRKSTLLQIRLRYWYEMKVPFANWIVFLSWYAGNADVALYGSIDRASTKKQNMLGPDGSVKSVGAQGKGIKQQKGFDTVYKPEMLVLWGLATGSIPLISGIVGKRYFMPLTATYSMRMQSNFQRKWIMHLNPSWGL